MGYLADEALPGLSANTVLDVHFYRWVIDVQ